MPIITCPHCGASRDMPHDRLPRKATAARCPTCFRSFPFQPAAVTQQTAAVTGEQIICPHCGLPRLIPTERITHLQSSISCRRCRRNFRLQTGQTQASNQTSSEQPTQLLNTASLLTESWELFCQRGWGLLAIYLPLSLTILLPLLLAATLLPALVSDNRPLAWGCLLVAVAYGFFGSSWLCAALCQKLIQPQLPIRQAIKQGARLLGPYAWLLLLLSLLVGGSALLFGFPGLLLGIWFLFSPFILLEQGGGLSALETSHQLVRGRWWAVFIRMLLLLLVAAVASLLAGRLPVIGTTVDFLISLLLTPFSLIYSYQLYLDLRRCQPAPMPPAKTTGRWLYLSLALLGWLCIPGLLILINNQYLAQDILPKESVSLFSDYSISFEQSLDELTAPPPIRPPLNSAVPLTAEEYQQLLETVPLAGTTVDGVGLGPATLRSKQVRLVAERAQLELQLTLAELPNLQLFPRRTVRILLDSVTSTAGKDIYQRNHNFETVPFAWLDLLADGNTAPAFSASRSIQLQPGSHPDQARSIQGRLELHLPLAIASLKLSREDVGKPLHLGDRQLKLVSLSEQQINLRITGGARDLIGLQAIDANQQPLRNLGVSRTQNGEQIEILQLVSGPIDQVTLFIAGDTLVRSYPFVLQH